MNLGEALAEALMRSAAQEASRDDDRDGDDICLDLTRARPILRDALNAWDKPNPFKAGDILKPAKHSSTFRESLGHVIVRRTTDRDEMELQNNSFYIASFDMRILVIKESGFVIEMQAHSRDFELVEAAK